MSWQDTLLTPKEKREAFNHYCKDTSLDKKRFEDFMLEAQIKKAYEMGLAEGYNDGWTEAEQTYKEVA